MKNSQASIAALLAAMMGQSDSGTVEFVQITPREGQSIADAIAEAEASHRAECDGCAAEYSAQQAIDKAATKESAEQERKDEQAMQAKLKAKFGAGEARTPVGYIAVIVRDGVERVIRSSFGTDLAEVQAKTDAVHSFGPLKALVELSEALGLPGPAVIVKPVYF